MRPLPVSGPIRRACLAVHLGFNPWLGLVIGTAVAGLAGFLIGVLCLRMGGIYLSLTTLGFSQILHIVITNEYEITRGTMGLQVPALMSVYSKTAYFYIMLAALIVTLLIIHRIIYSNTGLNFRAVQNDETAAAALGVNVVRVRVMAFTVSSALAGMAGGLFGHYLLLITPQIPSLDQQFLVLAMTVIGGMGSFIGPVIGAFMLNILAEYIRAYGEYHVLVFGLVALLMARFFPNGVVGLYKGNGKMPLLEGRQLSKRFGGVWALQQVDFFLEEGEIVGLIGPNGAGKTTLFNSVAAAFKPTTGRVFFRGVDITAKTPYDICRLGIARTFQIVRPFPEMTCQENLQVAFVNNHHKAAGKDWASSAHGILEFVGLTDQMLTLAKNLTLMEKKKLELARALATNPTILMLDEVLGGLNTQEINQALNLIKGLRDEKGLTIFWIEHVMGAIMQAADRVIVLDQGTKLMEGQPGDVVIDQRVIKAYLGE
jgi:ABC-type branched-subunit amino acid transport system ATPase component/ABC-type branched-subunit amino acid transport system permease subunit